MPYAVHTNVELQGLLLAQFPALQPLAIEITNARYLAITRAWVEQFAPYYRAYLAARGQTVYAVRGNQCEHYAIRAAMEAVDLFRQSTDTEIPADVESIAVAWAKYFRSDGRGWHEVDLWLLDGLWTPWEPQTQTFFAFTPAEITSVSKPFVP
jgi:hypothetical protein